MADGKDIPETANFFARRTESVDAAGIASLVQRRTETIFGRVNVEYIIERATLGITLVGSEEGEGEILAHGSLLDYPVATSGVDPASWELWASQTFTGDIRASPMNTLFLHLFVAKEGFQQAAIAEILRIAFVAVPLLQYIIITAPPATTLGSALQPHFSVWPVAEGQSPSHAAHVSHRHHHFPQLHVRSARVEDADDLMSIFTEYSHNISEDYGEYFLAELIESQDTQHKTIVAEVGGHSVGFVSVSAEVDLGLLNQSFQLETCHHLRHPAPLLESDLKSQSVQSIAASDHLQDSSSTSLVEGETEEKPADPSTGDKQKVEEGSQNQLASSSSLARLAQIAAATSSRSRLTQSRSKLASHSKTTVATSSKTTMAMSRTTVAKSDTKVAKSDTKVTESEKKVVEAGAKGTESKAKMTDSKITVSKSKMTTSKATMVESKAKVAESKAKVSPSKSRPTEEVSELGGAESAEAASSQSQMRGEKSASSEDTQAEREREERRKRLAGQSSAVAVQLFAIQDQYEMRSVDLLVAVFQAFPDHDFCLLSLPHTVSEFPLLSNFTRVPHRQHSTLPYELYVVHKCSLLHSFVVRPAVTSDLSSVRDLVEGVEGREGVMSDVVRGVEGGRDSIKDGATPLSALVAECADQIVGVAVVRREEELLYLRSHYSIEDFVYMSQHRPEEHGRLHHLILSPAFSPLTKHFLKEVMRRNSVTCLYYPFHPSSLPPFPSSLPPSHLPKPLTVSTVLADMVPVRPRSQVVYPDRERLGVNQPLPQVLEEKQQPFALYHINRKLSLEPKTVVNWRVVVVGASDTAVSLLETLVFSPHLAFTNLSLLSPSGLPPPSLPTSCCYQPQSPSLLGLSASVHLIPASITAINREEKEVVVWREGEEEEEGEEGVVPYDLLILATGLQFSPPPVTSDPDHGETPLIYHGNEGLEVLEWTQTHLQPEDLIVVYGGGLEVYTALQSLLAGGVDPSLITFVRPHPTSCFNNRTVEEKVQRSMEESGVQLISDHTLSTVEVGGVCLLDGDHTLFIECQGLVYMEEKEVSHTVFTAANDSCLVFDERLVIDCHHQTSDTAILAAGPMTKFSRSYHSNHWTHANFNSREVGQKLATSVLSRLDPTFQEPSVTSDLSLLPTYTQPKAIYTILPGGLHYLHIDKPRSSDPLLDQTSLGQELETDTENGYFRMFINQYSRVETITAISTQEIERTNFLCLYGLHEKYLNNLLSRHSEGLIPDLFTFFREPWTCAVFHDRFPDLREEVRETLSQQQPSAEDGESGTPSVEEKVRLLLNEQQTVSLEDQKEHLLSEFSQSPVKPAVQQLLHRYLRYNHYHLPMYAQPDIL